MRRCNKVRFHVSRPDDEGKSLCHIGIFGRVCSYCACDKQVHRLYTLYAFIKSVANVSVVEDSFSSTWFLFTYEGKCAVCQLFLRDETKTEGAFSWSLLNIAERQKSIEKYTYKLYKLPCDVQLFSWHAVIFCGVAYVVFKFKFRHQHYLLLIYLTGNAQSLGNHRCR